MKRNITVNIFGSLYPMDEDAYAMLNAYITNMRDYFSRQPDGKEISDDIEGRVAELMSELRQGGAAAISIEHIEEIINRVGKPEQFIEEESETNEPVTPPMTPVAPKKKLFRDPERKILGGVFGGLGCYIGVNPVWLRLAYILVIFGFFIEMPDTFPVILFLMATYIVCWASIPLAANPAERLQMKGEQVNLSNMCDEFLSSTREMLSRQSALNRDGRLTAGFASVLKWCVYAVAIFLIAACVAAVIGLLVAIVCTIAAPWGSLRNLLGDDFPVIVTLDSNPAWLIWVATISVVILLALTLYLLAHFTLRILGSVRPLSIKLRVVCLVGWLIALLFATSSITKIVSNTSIMYLQSRNTTKYKNLKDKKISQLQELNEAGWEIVKDNNIRNYTNKGEHYLGNRGLSYLDAGMYHDGLGMEYEAIRTLKLAPGIYRLEAKGRANGDGAEIFATNGMAQRFSAAIPVCGNMGGSVWNDARLALEADTAKVLPDRNHLYSLANANDSQGYGWSDVVVENIIVGPDSILRYGVTNVSPARTWDGTWLSATSFELKRQEEHGEDSVKMSAVRCL